jgi:hypothetical protein
MERRIDSFNIVKMKMLKKIPPEMRKITIRNEEKTSEIQGKYSY